jgi:hypothetical protein
MSGSGTTARVACEMGRKYIGIDISHEYCVIARQRVKQIERMPNLFIFEEPAIENHANDDDVFAYLNDGNFPADKLILM